MVRNCRDEDIGSVCQGWTGSRGGARLENSRRAVAGHGTRGQWEGFSPACGQRDALVPSGKDTRWQRTGQGTFTTVVG